jgi:hypothetical protein
MASHTVPHIVIEVFRRAMARRDKIPATFTLVAQGTPPRNFELRSTGVSVGRT